MLCQQLRLKSSANEALQAEKEGLELREARLRHDKEMLQV